MKGYAMGGTRTRGAHLPRAGSSASPGPCTAVYTAVHGGRLGLWRAKVEPRRDCHEEPAWWRNLQTHPEARLDLVDGPRQVTACAAVGDERSRLWNKWRDIDAI